MPGAQEPHTDILKLFHEFVPEISGGSVEIQGIAREPGYRVMVSVRSMVDGVDPVAACVGVQGSRVKAMSQRLEGEKLDIVRWSASIEEYIREIFAPAVIEKVVLDQNGRRAKVYVPADMRSLVIGRRGMRLELARQLTGWRLEILDA